MRFLWILGLFLVGCGSNGGLDVDSLIDQLDDDGSTVGQILSGEDSEVHNPTGSGVAVPGDSVPEVGKNQAVVARVALVSDYPSLPSTVTAVGNAVDVSLLRLPDQEILQPAAAVEVSVNYFDGTTTTEGLHIAHHNGTTWEFLAATKIDTVGRIVSAETTSLSPFVAVLPYDAAAAAAALNDRDGDGVPNDEDAFPDDPDESVDTDGDGLGDNADTDDDNDGTPDVDDDFPTSSTESTDTDGDGIGNNADPDDDGDGVDDDEDEFPLDPSETTDNDGDGIGDVADLDDDNDTWSDVDEGQCLTDPLDAESVPGDFDMDLECNVVDPDDDNDTRTDAEELLCGSDPFNPLSLPSDIDDDGFCDVLDTDSDGDGVINFADDFPLDPSETTDTDGDGIGNNEDTDDDNDGWSDTDEVLCLTEPLVDTNTPADTDSDGTCNFLDLDDDNDTWTDAEEAACLTDPLDDQDVPADFDVDDTCDEVDLDDDNDGTLDTADAFPYNAAETADTDLDGTGDNGDAFPFYAGAVSGVYLAPVQRGTADGTSWANASSDVTSALSYAASLSSADVWLEQGTYTTSENVPLLMMTSGTVFVRGGFAGSETQPSARSTTDMSLTILDATGTQSPALKVEGGYLFLELLTVTGGFGEGTSSRMGGGLYQSGGLVESNARFTGNLANDHGGSVAVVGGEFRNGVDGGTGVIENEHSGNYGSVHVDNSGSLIVNGYGLGSMGIIRNNSARTGGGVAVFDGEFVNGYMGGYGLVTDNTETHFGLGGGVYISGGNFYNGRMTGSTGMIAGNSSSDGGGGVYLEGGTFHNGHADGGYGTVVTNTTGNTPGGGGILNNSATVNQANGVVTNNAPDDIVTF